ncbi:arachidonate 12-lipoxygenase, 12R-type [Acrasis kona]|uniref:Arachidonate 12-lipoxygenase, 12R-type n=1 Tax=Acrasis kona TaxID=1008807 RepID=A0AAW2Z831_9EUKA
MTTGKEPVPVPINSTTFLSRLWAQLKLRLDIYIHPDAHKVPPFINPVDRDGKLLDQRATHWWSKLPTPLPWIATQVVRLVGVILAVLFYIPSFITINLVGMLRWGDSSNNIIFLIITELLYALFIVFDFGIHPKKKIRALLTRYLAPMIVEPYIIKERVKILTSKDNSPPSLLQRIQSYALQFHTLLSYTFRNNNQERYLTGINRLNQDGDHLPNDANERTFFPFGDGMAVASYKGVKWLLESSEKITAEYVGWSVSSSLIKYCESDPASDKDRIQKLMKNITDQSKGLNDREDNTEDRKYLDRFLQPNKHYRISEQDLITCVGDLFYYLTTKGQFTAEESLTYTSFIQNRSLFHPDWWNLLSGYSSETKAISSLDVMRRALWKRYGNPNSKAINDFIDNSEISNEKEELRLLTLFFSLFLSTCTRLCVSVVDRLYLNPEQNLVLYDEDPISFILETARLGSDAPTVSRGLVDSDKMLVHLSNLRNNTPLHAFIACANRDPEVFHEPYVFNIKRDNLDKLLTFDAIERNTHCDIKDFSLNVVKYLADRFKPTEKYIYMRQSTDPTMYARYRSMLDGYTTIMMDLVGGLPNSFPRAIEMYVPLRKVDQSLVRLESGVIIPVVDEDYPDGDPTSKFLLRELINSKAFGINDLDFQWAGVDQALLWMHKNFGAGLPLPLVEYKELESDDVMSRLAFFAMPCFYTRKFDKDLDGEFTDGESFAYVNDAIHVGDVDVSTLPVRDSFERYGAAAYFDEEYKIKAIYWCYEKRLVKPNDPSWRHAKWVWKSTFFMIVTVKDHLMVTHLTEANAFAKAAQHCLELTSPLKPFLKPFTYHTVTVNKNASLALVNKKGFVHRMWAFDYDTFLQVCEAVVNQYEFKILPDFIHESMRDMDDKDYPIWKDANEFYNVIHTYVKEYFELYPTLFTESTDFIKSLEEDLKVSINSEKKLIEVIAQLIVNGSAKHELVGQVADLACNPTFIGCKLETGTEIQNVQTFTQLMALTLLTGFRMPMLKDDWTHLFGQDEDQIKVYKKFRQELIKYEDRVDDRNKERKHEFPFFHPQNLQVSVSI